MDTINNACKPIPNMANITSSNNFCHLKPTSTTTNVPTKTLPQKVKFDKAVDVFMCTEVLGTSHSEKNS